MTSQLAQIRELMATKVKFSRIDPRALGLNIAATDPKRGL